jgi:hypothetical protein
MENIVAVDVKKIAVAVLTRGYQNLNQYNTLIKRNISIANHLGELRQIDILIFHEGNILDLHQNYIQKFTPFLNLKFINISEYAFKPEKKDISVFEPTRAFGLNYRHMCSFWFIDFWNFVKDYDMILRIDEDCIIDFNIPELFLLLNQKTAVYGAWTRDQDFVTHGLNKFTQRFIKETVRTTQNIIPHIPSGPYTNVIGLNLKVLRENTLLNSYIDKVKSLDYIYIFRWGDLPLWGEVLFYFCNSKSYLKYDKIKYFHGSHNFYVGAEQNINNLRKMIL